MLLAWHLVTQDRTDVRTLRLLLQRWPSSRPNKASGDRTQASMFSATFQDYDAYADAIERVDARFMLHNPGTSQWQINGLALPGGTTLQHCWSGSGAIAQGAAQGAGVELAIPAAGNFVANGERVPGDAALLMGKGQEFMVTIDGVHSWFNLYVPETRAQAMGLLRDPEGVQQEKTLVLRQRAAQPARVSRLLTDFLRSALAAPRLATSQDALAGFEAQLLAALAGAYDFPPGEIQQQRGRPPVLDEASILRAVEAIEASTNPSMPTAELAHAAQISERSLRAGFKKYLGLSPTRYMQLRTLNRARQRLSTSSPEETSVARVAADLGVWDLGRFAVRYRRLFGELPSTTLRKS